jgi:hypothetical protein
VGATVMCVHGGQAQPTAPNPRVTVNGLPTVTMVAPYVVAACPFAPGGVPTPCVTAQWMVAATRVTSNGQPLVLIDSQAVCVPNGTPLLITSTQTRVTAI